MGFKYGVMLVGCCAVAALVNILSTVAVAPYLGISSDVSIAATMRCVTIPIGLPTYERLCRADGREGNVSLMALCALMSSLFGFVLTKNVLSSFACSAPLADPIS